MGEFRGSADEPDHDDRPERQVPGTVGDAGSARTLMEPRSRAEYAADVRQRTVSEREQQPFAGHSGELADGADLRRFEPRRASLPDISADDAVAYVGARHSERPWLGTARASSPEVQRVIAALDRGGGHGHIRHEGWVTEEMNERRVAYLEDPAQSDPAKRSAGIDGLKQGDQPHRCRQVATRIIDPGAFAVAFARGIEHPEVRAALEAPFDPDAKPRPVQVPIEELLGPDGYRYCTGWRLDSVDGSMNAARRSRDAWLAAPADRRVSDVREPTARPVETFEGGAAVFAFGHNSGGDGYEVLTMYPRPPDHEC